MVVVDGVRKPREDKVALEILIRHAELYKAHVEVAQKYLSDCEMDIRDRELAILRIARVMMKIVGRFHNLGAQVIGGSHDAQSSCNQGLQVRSRARSTF